MEHPLNQESFDVSEYSLDRGEQGRLLDREVQVDPEIRAGPPCGISAYLLSRIIVANPAVWPGTIADLFQRPGLFGRYCELEDSATVILAVI